MIYHFSGYLIDSFLPLGGVLLKALLLPLAPRLSSFWTSQMTNMTLVARDRLISSTSL